MGGLSPKHSFSVKTLTMMPQPVRDWLAEHYSEEEVRAKVGGTRQNWSKRKPRLRKNAGLEVKPGAWLYRREVIDAVLGKC